MASATKILTQTNTLTAEEVANAVNALFSLEFQILNPADITLMARQTDGTLKITTSVNAATT